jgi:pimeloyl-ACP methyl ester carboxylesterase
MQIRDLVLILLVARSYQQLEPQTDLWNATFQLSEAQINVANISHETARNVEIALRYERTNNAGGPMQGDPFYDLPASYDASNPPPPGTILKVEEYTNLTLYTIPMSLSMSRFLYMTETFDGKPAPASAYVLWPYLPRKFTELESCSDDKSSHSPLFPVIGFAHGSCGIASACAPSGLRNLWDEFHEPYPLALAGYAIVAPDYLGLGVRNTTSPYFVLPSQANDLYHAVAAAQKAWPNSLSKQFVVAGQSQGGGVAWSAAQRQAQRPVDGYLGTVAMSPFTDILGAIAADNLAEDNSRVTAIAQGLTSIRPGFEVSEWLTEAGIARLRLLQEIQGCGITGGVLGDAEDLTVQILKDGWNLTESAQWYNTECGNGGKPFAGPMLVLQGTEDPNANEPVTTASVKQTCKMYPDSQLEYYRWVSHVLLVDLCRCAYTGVLVGNNQSCASVVRRPAHVS